MTEHKNVDLRKEQEAALARPRMKYSLMARTLFTMMDLVHGKATTLPKVKLLEVLARIPYQAWEIRQYVRLHSKFASPETVAEARDVIQWGRAAQDNEFWHLRVIAERMQQKGVRESWFHAYPVRWGAVITYTIFSRLLARFNIRRAFLLNAEFEDHAEHTYMQFVKDHPELDQEKPDSAAVREAGEFATWGDVFRRIGLDERDHMNDSLIHCGRANEVVPYLS
jgi:ubiquinol oxidase